MESVGENNFLVHTASMSESNMSSFWKSDDFMTV